MWCELYDFYQERLKKEQEEKEHKKKEKAEAHLYTVIKVVSYNSWPSNKQLYVHAIRAYFIFLLYDAYRLHEMKTLQNR